MAIKEARFSPNRRPTARTSVESPHSSLWSPRDHRSPGWATGLACAALSAASGSKCSIRSRLSRASSDLRSLATSSSSKPDRERSTSGAAIQLGK